MQQELIFEIGTEEIPAGYIIPALESLKENMAIQLKELNLSFGTIKGAATPRRLAICVEKLQERQPDLVEELLGPPKSAAYDANGNPTKAAEGFAKSKGMSLEDIQIASTSKGEYLMVVKERNGIETQHLLVDLLPELVKDIPFPKSMRWGDGRFTFARPIQWLVALFNGQPVPFNITGAGEAGRVTRGHRFMAPEAFEIASFDDYISSLREHHVLADITERREAVIAEITTAAQNAGGKVLDDDDLVNTVTNLVEKPHAICGSFDPKFLDLPNEVLITSMREHQKYFAITDADNKLMPNFIAVNNTKIKDTNLGAEGHQRVLRARLEDAMFFFKDDLNQNLADFVPALKGIVFQAKLGTMLDKTERVAKLAGRLAEKLSPENHDNAKRAAYLAKADLLSAMVNEFPSLQGVMGRDYAIRENEPLEVAHAIQEHYMPLRAGSGLPPSITGAIVGIADRIDTICGCFGIGQTPTGTTDPFGLRRLALGLIHIIDKHQFSLSLDDLINESLVLFEDKLTEDKSEARKKISDFIMGRYVNDKISKGTSGETVEAVTSVQFDDIIDCSLKIESLQSVSSQASFPLLANAFKRVMNIVKDHNGSTVDESLLLENAEKDLFSAYKDVYVVVEPLIASKQYEDAMQTILKMKEPVDRFFEDVMVMAEDEKLKNNRLALLSSIAGLFLKIGDFSKMYAINK